MFENPNPLKVKLQTDECKLKRRLKRIRKKLKEVVESVSK